MTRHCSIAPPLSGLNGKHFFTRISFPNIASRVPSYFYYEPWDGTKPVPAPRGVANWYGETVFNASVSGICQETCRDLGHTQMGIAGMINGAETAFIQGADLYSVQV